MLSSSKSDVSSKIQSQQQQQLLTTIELLGWSVCCVPGSASFTSAVFTPVTTQGLHQALHILLLPHFRMTGQCCDPILQMVKWNQRD